MSNDNFVKKIKYFEKNGELWFSYENHVSVPTKIHAAVYEIYKCSDIIPKEIIEQGEKSVKNYVKKKVKAYLKERKANDEKHNKFAANPNFPISVKYEDIVLKGKIISALDNVLVVRLEEPYQGEEYVIYTWASAKAKRYIFESLTSFSKDAIETAQKLLIQIYKEKKHQDENKEMIDLAKKLNSK